jgi:cytochrome c-type biogenesis protein
MSNPSKTEKSSNPQPQRFKLSRWLLLGVLFCGSVGLVWGVDYLIQSPVYETLSQFSFALGDGYDRWFAENTTGNPVALMGLAFLGGLVASISPCILSLLPVNLSYIGTREITSRRDAFLKASAFVLGVVTVLSLLGIFSSLSGIVLIRYRGYFQLVVGTSIVLMALSLVGVIHIPLPQFHGRSRPTSPEKTDPEKQAKPKSVWHQTINGAIVAPYGVGLTFALVSSPCTSPVMFSVLAAAGATGSQVQSSLAMVSYALGYTAIIFLASLFTGLAKQTRILLTYSEIITRFASLALFLVGAFYLITGGQWLWLSWFAT